MNRKLRMMTFLKKVLPIILLFTWLTTLTSGLSMTFAQEDDAAETAASSQPAPDEPVEGSIREQLSTNPEQALLQTYYRDQLEVYRAQEKTYQVAQAQLYQLNTLASLEEAVQATKQVMITRDQVLQTYFKLLRLRLIDAHGIPIPEKTLAINNLTKLEESLKEHELEVGKVTDRFSLAQSTQSFASLPAQFETVTNHALCLIAFGNIQTVYDKTIALMPEVEAKVKTKATDFELAKKQRALTEVNLLIATTKDQLDTIYTETFVPEKDRNELVKVYSSNEYGRLTGKLQSVYAQLSQMHEFIDEVMKL